MKQRGSASFEHLAAVVMVAVVGLGGLSVVGRTMGADVATAGPWAAPRASMAMASEAALTSFFSRGADVGAALVRQTAQEGAAYERARIVTEVASKAGDVRGVEVGLREVVDANDFETGRSLFRDRLADKPDKAYAYLLGGEFVDRLRALRTGDRWIDMGSGTGGAARDFYEAIRRGRHGFTHDFGRGALPEVTVVSRVGANTERFAEKYPGFRALYGRFVEEIPARELGKANVISDVFGPLSYSSHPDEVLRIYAKALRPGGEVFTVLRTNLSGSRGSQFLNTHEFLKAWLAAATGIRLSSVRLLDLTGSAVGVTFQRTRGRVHVPELTLLDAKPTRPPTRHYLMQ